MKPINVEVLMGHSTGISDFYYRATENELLEDYLKAVDFLTIDHKYTIAKRYSELEERKNVDITHLNQDLHEKHGEIEALRRTDNIKDDVNWEWRAANLVISVSIPHDNTNLEESLLAAVLQKYMGANIHGGV